MENKNITYTKEIVDLVIDVYGKSSDVFHALIKGEDITNLVKATIKKKGKSYRIRDKKQLLRLCKKEEPIIEL